MLAGQAALVALAVRGNVHLRGGGGRVLGHRTDFLPLMLAAGAMMHSNPGDMVPDVEPAQHLTTERQHSSHTPLPHKDSCAFCGPRHVP